MIERGGKLRLVPVKDAKMEMLGPALEEHISPEAHTIYTDESAAYAIYLQRHFDAERKTINHSRTYGIGGTHTNTIENAFSLLKRGVCGTFHKVSIKHLAAIAMSFPIDAIARGAIADVRRDAQGYPERKSPALQKAHGFARIGVLGPRRP
jgi:hypothetical protein